MPSLVVAMDGGGLRGIVTFKRALAREIVEGRNIGIGHY